MLVEFFGLWLIAIAILAGFSVWDRNPSLGIVAGALLLLLGLLTISEGIQYKSGESVVFTGDTGVTSDTFSSLSFTAPASTQTVIGLPLILTGIGVVFGKAVALV